MRVSIPRTMAATSANTVVSRRNVSNSARVKAATDRRSACLPRHRAHAKVRDQAEIHVSRQLHHAADGCGHTFPLAGFNGELPGPIIIVFGAPARFRDGPLRLNPALMLGAMECRVGQA